MPSQPLFDRYRVVSKVLQDTATRLYGLA